MVTQPSINLFLDDERATPVGYVRTYTVEQTLAILRYCHVNTLSLDNDLGIAGLENEGRQVIYQLSEWKSLGWDRWPKAIKIHSANPVARDWMRGMILRYGGFTWDANAQTFWKDASELK